MAPASEEGKSGPEPGKEGEHKGRGHRRRLREKFLSAGLAGFHDYEVIELLLTLGTPRKDCKEIAKTALLKFRTLQGVLEAGARELSQVPGIGPKNLIAVRLVRAVAERYFEKRLLLKDPIHNSRELFDYLYHDMREKGRECFKVIYLDAKNRVIASATLFEGTLTASAVYPREVVAAAIENRAAALIFAHNHPSGDPDPSSEDVAITRQLVFACQVMGITVHEHIVIGDGRYFSFADQGYISRMMRELESKWKGNEKDAG